MVKNEVKRTFNPEFLNRLDEIIIFMALNETDLIQILELMVTQLNQNLAQKSITVTVADEAKKWILNQTLTDRSYGARPLRRALQKYIEDPLSEALIQGTITTRPAFIEVFLEDNKLFYRPVDSEKAEGVLLYENLEAVAFSHSRQPRAGGFCYVIPKQSREPFKRFKLVFACMRAGHFTGLPTRYSR